MLKILSNANRRNSLKFRLQLRGKDRVKEGKDGRLSRVDSHSDSSVGCGVSAGVIDGSVEVR